ncbi:hypothetical protein F8388_005118 [Cannabis sativa]|uniref:RNA helicase n=1 Tax=Cannabis sativa TaxID=3483 RepID=A0A7J6DUV3_CANSA|nr:hypothetical protein F8388_005118 [Cannabis sativa]KAF4402116.1 hypothetical protein G4B88_017628 [Cannabis sativa]
MRVFATTPAEYSKVILATNIAKTSVTIPGIKYVINPGLVKARSYDPKQGLESLTVVPISKAQALQRSLGPTTAPSHGRPTAELAATATAQIKPSSYASGINPPPHNNLPPPPPSS